MKQSDTSLRQRPLAPDLQAYRPTLTMVMSIVHRITGVALYLGFAATAAWLLALAGGSQPYAAVRTALGSPLGIVVLFCFTWALLHHAFGGVRHLIWDLSIAHTYPWREYLTRATLLASLACSALFWLSLALFGRGSP
jgi:succinate dehydrogenase / fumarate reductase cytochrome b subunit